MAEQVQSLLRNVVMVGTGTRAQVGDVPISGKTGTTEGYGDAWFVGWTPDYTIAVWVGYPNEFKSMETEFNGEPVAGGTFPAGIFKTFVESILRIYPPEEDEEETETPTAPAPSATAAPTAAPETSEPAPAPEDTAPAPEETAPRRRRRSRRRRAAASRRRRRLALRDELRLGGAAREPAARRDFGDESWIGVAIRPQGRMLHGKPPPPTSPPPLPSRSWPGP